MYNSLRVIVWAIGVPVIVWLVVSIVRRTRAISQRIAEVRAEEAQNARNPYAQMAALYEQEEARKQLKKARHGKV